MGGKDKDGKEIKTVEVVSLDKDVAVPSCLQKRKDITFSAVNAAGSVLGIDHIFSSIITSS